jgi:hypothetical protein
MERSQELASEPLAGRSGVLDLGILRLPASPGSGSSALLPRVLLLGDLRQAQGDSEGVGGGPAHCQPLAQQQQQQQQQQRASRPSGRMAARHPGPHLA